MLKSIKCFFGKHEMQNGYFWFNEERKVLVKNVGKLKKTYKRCRHCGTVKAHELMKKPKSGDYKNCE